MESIRNPFANITGYTGLIALAVLLCTPIDSFAQVRTKKPDRGVYRPPSLEPVADEGEAEPLSKLIRTRGDIELSNAPEPTGELRRSSNSVAAKWGAPLVDTKLTDAKAVKSSKTPVVSKTRPPLRDPASRRVGAEHSSQASDRTRLLKTDPIQLAPPHRPQQAGDDIETAGGEVWVDEGQVYYEPDSYTPVLEPSYGGCDACDSGCDSIGCNNLDKWCNSANAYLSLAPDRWFASAELMLMFRKGDGLPALVTTGNPDLDTEDGPPIGSLERDDTVVLVGEELIFKDLTAGGRLTLGTWLDCQRCRSLVMRGWFAGEQRYRFSANQDHFDVLTRPFLNVDDGQDPAADSLVIAAPGRANGSVSVFGDSNVYGADVSVRQLWHGQYGGIVDLLYGYQFMRMDENLAIGSTSTSLDEDFAPVGAVLSVYDSFDVKNDFHGAQLGLASSYRERCWSFRGLFKLGMGALRRRANLNGQSTTSIDGATAVVPNGLLVRGTNSGNYSDTEFAWSPELDLTLGWQRFPMFDVTFGYHIVALTDALQVSRTLDPQLAVNTEIPPLGAQRPAAIFRYDTYYVQGIHFGLQYIY